MSPCYNFLHVDFFLFRVEYDAYRTDIETATISPRDPVKQDEAQKKFAAHRAKYDKLRTDVSIKLKFLEENKVCLTHINLCSCYHSIG